MISHHGTFTLVDKLEFKILHLHVTISFKKRFPKKPPDPMAYKACKVWYPWNVNSNLIKKSVYTLPEAYSFMCYTLSLLFFELTRQR